MDACGEKGGSSLEQKGLELLKAMRCGNAVALRDRRGEVKTFEVRLCGSDRLGEVLRLQQEVYEAIPDKKTFVTTSREELLESLELDFCIGAFSGGRLEAFTLMVANRTSPRNLGSLYGEGALRSVTYDTTFVGPRCRGYGIQRFFIELKDALASAIGAVEAYATVSPDNIHSLNNLAACGFDVVEKRLMYGGRPRYILKKALWGTCAGEGPS